MNEAIIFQSLERGSFEFLFYFEAFSNSPQLQTQQEAILFPSESKTAQYKASSSISLLTSELASMHSFVIIAFSGSAPVVANAKTPNKAVKAKILINFFIFKKFNFDPNMVLINFESWGASLIDGFLNV
jgi:hypothetical protein